jgi:ubiquinone/menaquinone biosynthesis C-methylase UbiE
MTVLDMASGTGSVARAAASAGGLVWGLDLTWDMLAQADRAPTDPGHCVRWVQGDAMTLPFADGSFDRVLSSMGVMFVGDDRRAAQELARVCRGRGVIGLCSWTPEGVPGLVGRTVASFLSGGNATDDAGPMRWGTEEHVRRLFGGCGVEFERTGVPAQTESAAAYIRLLAGSAGPLVACRRVLSGQGRWEAFCDHLVALLEARNETPGTGWRADQEYLVAVIRPRDAGPAG